MPLRVKKRRFPNGDVEFEYDDKYPLYPDPEEQFHFYERDSKVGWVEGAPKTLTTGEEVYVGTVLEVIEDYRGRGYSLKMLKCIHARYRLPIVPVKVHNTEYWDHMLSKHGDSLQLRPPLSDEEFEVERSFWREQVK